MSNVVPSTCELDTYMAEKCVLLPFVLYSEYGNSRLTKFDAVIVFCIRFCNSEISLFVHYFAFVHSHLYSFALFCLCYMEYVIENRKLTDYDLQGKPWHIHPGNYSHSESS